MLAYAPAVQAVPADPSCTSSYTYDFVFWTWTPSGDDANGIRAPIKLRRDGELCTNTSNYAFNASWIGIYQQPGTGNNLAQIGVEHDFANGVGHWCRFWAVGTGFPAHDYYCADADDTQIYFKIEVTGSPPVYAIYDCGTAGNFGPPCTLKDSSQGTFAEPIGTGTSEVDYSCVNSGDVPVIRMMGQGSDRVWFGNSSWNIDGKDSNGWAQRSWTFNSPFCTMDYQGATSTDGLRTWDARNTS